MQEFLRRAKEVAEVIRGKDRVLVVTHIDADGITSGAIAVETLERLGIDWGIEFVKSLDAEKLSEIADENEFVWFTDLGSGVLDKIIDIGIDCVITDHHTPAKGYYRYHLNPNEFGLDGTYELCGATTTYIVSKLMGLNYDLSPLAVVGAVGDLQDSRDGRLLGFNRTIAEESAKFGLLRIERDIRLFGKQTRPVFKMLEYTFDPYLPGISGNERGALDFLESVGVSVKDGDNWRRWIDLTAEEKRAIVSGLVKLCVEYGVPVRTIKRLVGETYILLREEEGTELRDAMEYSTLLNATARYGRCEVGLKVCLGDRDRAFREARNLLRNHRKNLSEGVKLVDEKGVIELENVQYFHAGHDILDTIVGIVAGMCFYKVNPEKPIVAFAYCENGVKVSARATRSLVERGVHLAKAIREAAERVGGSGGGHSVAAGAVIPRGTEEEFIRELDRIIGMQMKGLQCR